MSTVITVTNTAAPLAPVVVRVISQKIVDEGRELVPNGVDEVPAGKSVDFIINAGQSIRVIEEPALAAEAATEASATEAAAVIA